ncbi:hypothetical protein ASF99_13425 [Exiguobacterium sp. Leaf187]|uniref:hypothetical protein n=1 Tax=Exiguobacterium sp. Leaf187 TaxID=1736294 RepID=UPI0006FC1838|nr:hypothetical protein [Exiguobacterium sp. Leaf187]KQS23500.1 hypothetical protein ASF99_13425 [Exiguobacterium sp. Leaf187]
MSQLPEVSILGNMIKLPNLKWVRFANSKLVAGRILNATIRRTASGKYFVSLLVAQDINKLLKMGVSVHIHHDRDMNAEPNLKQGAERILASSTARATELA